MLTDLLFILELLLLTSCGAAIAALASWRTPRLACLLPLGYLTANLLHLPLALMGIGHAWPFLATLACIVLLIGFAATRPQARARFLALVRGIGWREPLLYVAILLLAGWPFLGPAAAPWGTANGDLFDSFNGAWAFSYRPDTIHEFIRWRSGSLNTGQYTAAAFAFRFSGDPIGLLSDYRHLLMLYAMNALGVAALARDGLGLSRAWSVFAALLTGCSCLLLVTLLNGHVGTTIYLPLALLVLHSFIPGDRQAPPIARFGILAAAVIFVFCSYGYTLGLILGPLAILACARFQERLTPGNPLRRPGFPGLMVVLVAGTAVAIIAAYPLFDSFRSFSLERYRSWGIAVRPEMIGITWGFDPSGLSYTSHHMRLPLPAHYKLAGGACAFAIAAIGVLCLRSQPGARLILAWTFCAVALFAGIRLVVDDSYYTYKSIYLSFPLLALLFTLPLARLSRLGWVAGALAVAIAVPLLLVNLWSSWMVQREIANAPFNRHVSASVEGTRALRSRLEPGGTASLAPTSYEFIEIANHIAQRETFSFATHPWVDLQKTIRSKGDNRQEMLLWLQRAIEERARTESRADGGQNLRLTPVLYPDILHIDGPQPDVIWSNELWRIEDRSRVPFFEVWCPTAAVTRLGSSLYGAPFRWMRDQMSFYIARWPATHRHLSFYAEAGYGTTSRRFDLTVRVNGTVVDSRTIGTPIGTLVDLEIPMHLVTGGDSIEFSGSPQPGPPLALREYRDLRLRLAAVRLRPEGAPLYDPTALALSAPERWTARLGDATVCLGDGWGPEEIDENGTLLRDISPQGAVVVATTPLPANTALRLTGQRLSGKTVLVNSSAGWSRVLPVRNTEMLIPFPDGLGAHERLRLNVQGEPPVLTSDGRPLHFRLHRIELIGP